MCTPMLANANTGLTAGQLPVYASSLPGTLPVNVRCFLDTVPLTSQLKVRIYLKRGILLF